MSGRGTPRGKARTRKHRLRTDAPSLPTNDHPHHTNSALLLPRQISCTCLLPDLDLDLDLVILDPLLFHAVVPFPFPYPYPYPYPYPLPHSL